MDTINHINRAQFPTMRQSDQVTIRSTITVTATRHNQSTFHSVIYVMRNENSNVKSTKTETKRDNTNRKRKCGDLKVVKLSKMFRLAAVNALMQTAELYGNPCGCGVTKYTTQYY